MCLIRGDEAMLRGSLGQRMLAFWNQRAIRSKPDGREFQIDC